MTVATAPFFELLQLADEDGGAEEAGPEEAAEEPRL